MSVTIKTTVQFTCDDPEHQRRTRETKDTFLRCRMDGFCLTEQNEFTALRLARMKCWEIDGGKATCPVCVLQNAMIADFGHEDKTLTLTKAAETFQRIRE